MAKQSKKKIDINQILLKAHKLGVRKAIDSSARNNSRLVIYEDGKLKEIRPKYRYVRVSNESSTNKNKSKTARAIRRKK